MNSCIKIYLFAIILLPFCFNCKARQVGKPAKVEVRKTASGYEFLRNGRPYFVKGAGGTSKMEELKAAGGNSVRTWSTDGAEQLLVKAGQLGLTVTMGLNVARERHGFNYDDAAAVKKQQHPQPSPH